ncbi:MAG: cytochrome b N-terminal domain-containing protein, partial [Nitrososphaerota archaeon]|nr:cytochrome b N-terminal domain-containing protein [Nitrososphaerota archaeon]
MTKLSDLRETISKNAHSKFVSQYTSNPIHKIGTLIVIAFIIEAITGFLLLLHYEPDPGRAYASTRAILGRLPYGNVIGTLHLYTAYAIILLTFIHGVRNYFLDLHILRKGIWISGVVMGLVTFGLIFTGSLLPWTMISKSHLELLIKIINDLPLSRSIDFEYLRSPEGQGALLIQSYYLHVIVLPLILLILLVFKIRMLISQRIFNPISMKSKGESRNLTSRASGDFTYILMLALLFTAFMLATSALFPSKLPPEFSSINIGNQIPKPEWYLLWIYELSHIFPIAQGLMACILAFIISLVILTLPLIDKPKDG